jgi:hypothetical protein
VDSPVNTLLGNSLAPVSSRVRQLVRDFPILARAVEIGTTYTVGDGIRFQGRVKDPSGEAGQKMATFRLTQLGSLCILALVRSCLIYPLESRLK